MWKFEEDWTVFHGYIDKNDVSLDMVGFPLFWQLHFHFSKWTEIFSRGTTTAISWIILMFSLCEILKKIELFFMDLWTKMMFRWTLSFFGVVTAVIYIFQNWYRFFYNKPLLKFDSVYWCAACVKFWRKLNYFSWIYR